MKQIHTYFIHMHVYEIRVSLLIDGCVSCATLPYIMHNTHIGKAIAKSIMNLKINSVLEISNTGYIIYSII